MMVDTEEAVAVTGGQIEHPLSSVELAEEAKAAVPAEETKERPPEPPEPHGATIFLPAAEATINLFKMKRFLVLRPGTLNQAITDVTTLVDKEVDGSILGMWLMAEVDHWNNEKERLVIVTDNSLMVFKYDFLMFNCEQLQRIPLHFVDRISHGNFTLPRFSVLKREGDGVRIFWDRQREPTFTSRWNPFSTELPYITFTYHPVRNISPMYNSLCDIMAFRDKIKDAAQKASTVKPIPGRANGVMLLNQPILIEAYVGAMSFLGNENRLGYSIARGNIGF